MSSSSTSILARIFPTSSLVKLQVISGAAFGSFLSLHLLNIGLVHFGIDYAEKVQRLFRLYYQNTYIEPLVVVASLLVHIFANSILTMRRWAREKNPKAIKPLSIAQKLNRYSSYILMLFIPTHIMGLRLPGVILGPEFKADLSLISFVLQQPGFVLVPISIMGITGLYHMTFGLVQVSDRLLKTSIARRRFLESRWFLLAIGIGAGAIVSSLLALKGVDLGSERNAFWTSYFDKVSIATGIDLRH